MLAAPTPTSRASSLLSTDRGYVSDGASAVPDERFVQQGLFGRENHVSCKNAFLAGPWHRLLRLTPGKECA